ERRAALLRPSGPRRLRQCLGWRRPENERAPRRGAAAARLLDQPTGPADAVGQQRDGVLDRQRRRTESQAEALERAGPASGGSLDAQRANGPRPDAEGRIALTSPTADGGPLALDRPASARTSGPRTGVGAHVRALLPLSLRALSVLIALVMLIPLFFVIGYTIVTGWATSYDLLVRPRVAELLFNTLRLTVASVAACAVIGLGAAWLTERTTLPSR